AGPTGGEGFAAPAGICSLIDPTTFLATLKSFLVAQSRTPLARASAARLRRIDCCFVASGLLYLHKVQFDRSCTAEDRDQNAHLALFGLDFLDGAVEVLERAVNDFDRLAHLEQHLGLGPQGPFFHLLLDLCDFGHRNFGRIGGVSDEAGNFRRVLDDVPGLVVEHHLHEDVAGEKLAAGNLARARSAPAPCRFCLPCEASAPAPRARPWPCARSPNRYGRHTISSRAWRSRSSVRSFQ